MRPPVKQRGRPTAPGTPSSTSHHRAASPQHHTAPEPGTITYLPVPSLIAALNHLDELDLCCCWVASRRCPMRWPR